MLKFLQLKTPLSTRPTLLNAKSRSPIIFTLKIYDVPSCSFSCVESFIYVSIHTSFKKQKKKALFNPIMLINRKIFSPSFRQFRAGPGLSFFFLQDSTNYCINHIISLSPFWIFFLLIISAMIRSYIVFCPITLKRLNPLSMVLHLFLSSTMLQQI